MLFLLFCLELAYLQHIGRSSFASSCVIVLFFYFENYICLIFSMIKSTIPYHSFVFYTKSKMIKITFVAIKFIFYINYFEFNTIKVKYLIYFSFHSLIPYSYEFYWCSVFPLRDKAFLAATAYFMVIKEITTNTIHPTVAVIVFNYLQFCSFILKYLAYFSFHNL